MLYSWLQPRPPGVAHLRRISPVEASLSLLDTHWTESFTICDDAPLIYLRRREHKFLDMEALIYFLILFKVQCDPRSRPDFHRSLSPEKHCTVIHMGDYLRYTHYLLALVHLIVTWPAVPPSGGIVNLFCRKQRPFLKRSLWARICLRLWSSGAQSSKILIGGIMNLWKNMNRESEWPRILEWQTMLSTSVGCYGVANSCIPSWRMSSMGRNTQVWCHARQIGAWRCSLKIGLCISHREISWIRWNGDW